MPLCLPTEHRKGFEIRKGRFYWGKKEKHDSLRRKVSRRLGQENQKMIIMKKALCTAFAVSSRAGYFPHLNTSPALPSFARAPWCSFSPKPCPSAACPACTSPSLCLCGSAHGRSPKEGAISLFLHRLHLSCPVLLVSISKLGTKKHITKYSPLLSLLQLLRETVNAQLKDNNKPQLREKSRVLRNLI